MNRMAQIPTIVSVSDLRNKYKEILESAKAGPILILAYDKVKAVILSPADYDELIGENEDLKREVERLKTK